MNDIPQIRLAQLEPDQLADFLAMLSSRHVRQAKAGKHYLLLDFRDGSRRASHLIWEDHHRYALAKAWLPGSVYRIRGVLRRHEQYGMQLEIVDIREWLPEDEKEGMRPDDLIPASRHDPHQMLAELKSLVEAEMGAACLKKLVLDLLAKHRAAWLRAPATLNKFYPFLGGLLQHTLSVAKKALWLADRYRDDFSYLIPPVNRDIVLAAAVLHDIGRILEYDTTALEPRHTVAGRLLGHLFLGRDLVRDAALAQGDFPPELLLTLEHVIVSHLNLPEWGSPRLPLVPESLILHHADDLDAKMEMYVRCLTSDQAPGPFTERHPVLDRHLYKGRTV